VVCVIHLSPHRHGCERWKRMGLPQCVCECCLRRTASKKCWCGARRSSSLFAPCMPLHAAASPCILHYPMPYPAIPLHTPPYPSIPLHTPPYPSTPLHPPPSLSIILHLTHPLPPHSIPLCRKSIPLCHTSSRYSCGQRTHSNSNNCMNSYLGIQLGTLTLAAFHTQLSAANSVIERIFRMCAHS